MSNLSVAELEACCQAHAKDLYRVLKDMLQTAEEIDTVGTITDAQWSAALTLIKEIEQRD